MAGKAKLVQISYEMVQKQSIVLVRCCVGMVVPPWHVGSTLNGDAVQQSHAVPETVLLMVDGWRLMLLK